MCLAIEKKKRKEKVLYRSEMHAGKEYARKRTRTFDLRRIREVR